MLTTMFKKPPKPKVIAHIEKALGEIKNLTDQKLIIQKVDKLAIEIYQYVKRHKEDINQTNDCGQTALIFACDVKKVDLSPVVKALLHHGADIHHEDDDGQTALNCAAFHGNEKQVEKIVNHARGEIDFVISSVASPCPEETKNAKDLIEKAKNSFFKKAEERAKTVTSVFSKDIAPSCDLFTLDVVDLINGYDTNINKQKK